MIGTRISTAPRTHAVTMTPTAVIVAVGLVVARVVAHSHRSVDTDALHRAGIQHRQRKRPESGRHPTITHVHFGSTLLSLSVHSISPNGAPAGSATSATCPP